jgi:hypothetical protein
MGRVIGPVKLKLSLPINREIPDIEIGLSEATATKKLGAVGGGSPQVAGQQADSPALDQSGRFCPESQDIVQRSSRFTAQTFTPLGVLTSPLLYSSYMSAEM